MAGHTSEKRWRRNQTSTSGQGISDEASQMANRLVTTLLDAEQMFLEMQELFQFVGSTADGLATQLFAEDIAGRSSPENVPSAEELAMTQDLIDSITAGHDIYEAANNQVVPQEDRLAQLRRMS